MLWNAKLLLLCLALLPAWVGGCGAPRPSTATFGIRRVSVDVGAAMAAAETALLDAGYRIDRRDEAAGLLTTFPIFSESRGAAEGSRRRLVSPSQLRRLAETRIERSADGVTVYCKIVVQEQVSEVYRWREGDLRSDESPSATPIDREAGTTRRQNTVWKTIRRDKAQERKILNSISEQTDSLAPPTGEQSEQ